MSQIAGSNLIKCSALIVTVFIGASSTSSGDDASRPADRRALLEFDKKQPSSPETWRPVPYGAQTPRSGVTVGDGLFKPVMEGNIEYLLTSFSVDDMLYWFRKRAGVENPPHDKEPINAVSWEPWLKGSMAGRFLMGAANTLRWIEHEELRRRSAALIDGIEAARADDGNIFPMTPEEFDDGENGNYARAWLTHGLVDAGITGFDKAYTLLRSGYDWFNQNPRLPEMLLMKLGIQGHIGNTRVYFTPVGKPQDMQTAEKYYVLNWWIDQLAARQPEAIWKFPLDRPHCYELTAFEAYLDHYRATGDQRYYEAAHGAWEMFREHWMHIGGSVAICEHMKYPPGTCYIDRRYHTGELCGSVFWIKLNQRFHLLNPEDERYVAEIERSIYNVGLANALGADGVRYHTYLQGHKDGKHTRNSCCEGQGTRLYGSLPEYIFSLAEDGVYVNLYEPATLACPVGKANATLKLETRFPFNPDVTLTVGADQPVKMKVRLRIPQWCTGPVEIRVNGEVTATGEPGAYETLSRTWSSGDQITFTLRPELRTEQYHGADEVPGHTRYALLYGPILLAVVPQQLQGKAGASIAADAQQPTDWLSPLDDRPLHYAVVGRDDLVVMPYWQINAQAFTVFPTIDKVKIDGPMHYYDKAEVRINSVAGQVHYTMDGSDPTPESPRYDGPLTIRSSATVKAQLYEDGAPISKLMQRRFEPQRIVAPTIRPTKRPPLRYEILVAAPSDEVDVHYTLDGTEPTRQSPRYQAPLDPPADGTLIRARALTASRTGPVAQYQLRGDDYPWPMPDVPLHELTVRKATTGWGKLEQGKNPNGDPLRLMGQPYPLARGVHAKSDLVYDAPADAARFVALVGLDEATSTRGTANFEVYVDDVLHYRTPLLRGGDIWHIDVPLPDEARQIRLHLTDGGDGYSWDWGNWVRAGFVRDNR